MPKLIIDVQVINDVDARTKLENVLKGLGGGTGPSPSPTPTGPSSPAGKAGVTAGRDVVNSFHEGMRGAISRVAVKPQGAIGELIDRVVGGQQAFFKSAHIFEAGGFESFEQQSKAAADHIQSIREIASEQNISLQDAQRISEKGINRQRSLIDKARIEAQRTAILPTESAEAQEKATIREGEKVAKAQRDANRKIELARNEAITINKEFDRKRTEGARKLDPRGEAELRNLRLEDERRKLTAREEAIILNKEFDRKKALAAKAETVSEEDKVPAAPGPPGRPGRRRHAGGRSSG